MGKDHIFGTSDNLGVDKTQTPLGGTDAGASQLVAIFTACSQLQKIKQKRPPAACRERERNNELWGIYKHIAKKHLKA